jgi:hypothetical protein
MRSAAAADCHLHHAAHTGDVQGQEGVVGQQVLRQVRGLRGRQSVERVGVGMWGRVRCKVREAGQGSGGR